LGKSLAEIEALSGWELACWKAYHAVEPLPDAHWDQAHICSVIASVMSARGKRYSVDDFLPWVQPKVRRARQTPEEMYKALRIATGYGGNT
jgi:hypothetical protein